MINKYSKFFIFTFKNIGVCLAVAALTLATIFCCPNFNVATAKGALPQTATAQETPPQTSPEYTSTPQETQPQTLPKYTATVTSPTPQQFMLGWDKIANATSYSVACNGCEILQNVVEAQCDITQVLTEGGEYNFLITAYQNGSSLFTINFQY
ncbi:MAG: hypothetical protein RSB09_00560, partial [Clostridia bacterium]